MTKDIKKKLKSRWENFTTAEKKIASYLLQNINGIPFETASSLGRRVGVSAMTVGRFLRSLGYVGLGELKEELRDRGGESWQQIYGGAGGGNVASPSESFQSEIRELTVVHALTHTAEWTAIVARLVNADRVTVASFHHGRFLGIAFASLLQHVKPRTSFADGLDGAYTDVLLDSTESSCVVLIDFRRYSRHFRLLAEEISQRGIPLVIITDTQCYWARRLTDNVLMLPIDDHRTWHNFTAASSLFSLLIGAVSNHHDDRFERIGEITQLRQKFVGYVEAPSPARLMSKATAKGRASREKAAGQAIGKRSKKRND